MKKIKKKAPFGKGCLNLRKPNILDVVSKTNFKNYFYLKRDGIV